MPHSDHNAQECQLCVALRAQKAALEQEIERLNQQYQQYVELEAKTDALELEVETLSTQIEEKESHLDSPHSDA